MKIAQKLRKENIAEYLLYMWQMEDLIRAFGCSLPVIRRNYISQFKDLTDEELDDEIDWFSNLIRMMNEEGKREAGHLNINAILVRDLEDLHAQLLESTKFPFYSGQYYKCLPFIVEIRQKNKQAEAKARRDEEDGIADNDELALLNSGIDNKSEIETCFEALYGTMILRMQGKEISKETQIALKEITTFVGLLNDYYLKDKTEGLKFYDE